MELTLQIWGAWGNNFYCAQRFEYETFYITKLK